MPVLRGSARECSVSFRLRYSRVFYFGLFEINTPKRDPHVENRMFTNEQLKAFAWFVPNSWTSGKGFREYCPRAAKP